MTLVLLRLIVAIVVSFWLTSLLWLSVQLLSLAFSEIARRISKRSPRQPR